MRVLAAGRGAWQIPAESLGLWRLATGLLLLAEWSDRVAHLDPLYLREGLRRSGDLMRLVEGWTGPWPGEAIVMLAAAGMVSAAAWTAGWMTRWAQVVALLTFGWFTNVNLMTGHAGDVFLVGMLFWSLPLRCGAAFSLDRLLRFKAGGTEFPGAGLALLGQLALVYGLAGLAKTGEAWQTGEALHRALAGSLGSPIGAGLAAILPGWLLAWIGRGVPWVEGGIACLILCPWFRPWPRRAALILTTIFQAALVIGMDLGLLPWLMLAANLLLVQPEDWARWATRPGWTIPVAEMRRRRGWGMVWVAFFGLTALVSADGTLRRTWGLSARFAPGWLWRPLHLAQLQQDWGMFAPDVRPFRTDFRLEVEGTCGTVWTFGDRDSSFLGASGKGWRKFIEQAAGSRRDAERDQLLALAAREAVRNGVDVRVVRLIRVLLPLSGTKPEDVETRERVVGEIDFATRPALAPPDGNATLME